MQGAEHQVPCFSGRDRQLDRFQITHLPYQDHVGVFPQGSPQGGGEAAGVFPQLALVDHALLVAVGEFDRVLDREDVLGAVAVDVIQQRRQGGGFA